MSSCAVLNKKARRTGQTDNCVYPPLCCGSRQDHHLSPLRIPALNVIAQRRHAYAMAEEKTPVQRILATGRSANLNQRRGQQGYWLGEWLRNDHWIKQVLVDPRFDMATGSRLVGHRIGDIPRRPFTACTDCPCLAGMFQHNGLAELIQKFLWHSDVAFMVVTASSPAALGEKKPREACARRGYSDWVSKMAPAKLERPRHSYFENDENIYLLEHFRQRII
jgi:hypothetical protein